VAVTRVNKFFLTRKNLSQDGLALLGFGAEPALIAPIWEGKRGFAGTFAAWPCRLRVDEGRAPARLPARRSVAEVFASAIITTGF
jgi:hypothetical protein